MQDPRGEIVVDIHIQSWITQSEDKLALGVYPDLSRMYIHAQLDEAAFCLYTLDEITFLIFRVTRLKVIFSDFLAELCHSEHVFPTYTLIPVNCG